VGEIVGAGIVAHVPTIMLPEEVRLEINDGKEITLVPGLKRLRSEVLDRLEPDTIVILDTHWESTFEHIITSAERREGKFTSHELPRGMRQIPYDMPGDPELANALQGLAEGRDDTWVLASDDPCLPVFYGTINIWSHLGKGERWASVSINQCGQTEDFLLLGELLGEADDSLLGAHRESDEDVVELAGFGARDEVFERAGEARDVVAGFLVSAWRAVIKHTDEPHTEGQLRVRALDPELVWLAHEHEPWRPRTV